MLRGRLAALKQERSSWEDTWRDIADQMVPYRVAWPGERRNDGKQLEGNIINNTPVRSLNVLAAGMMAGVTSPARKWFGMSIDDREALKIRSVKVYLDEVARIIRRVLASSNWYHSLSNGTYVDLGSIGTSAIFLDEISPGVPTFKTLPIGEYFLDADKDGDVNVCFRDLFMTSRNMVRKFGIDKVSNNVKQAFNRGEFSTRFRVGHAVMPNEDFQPEQTLTPRGKAFSSFWWEILGNDEDKLLLEDGYHEFPVLAPRWYVRPGDIYGRGPGWEIRGDCRALQHKEKILIKMLDKTVDPPLQVSQSVKRASLLPGAITHVPDNSDSFARPLIEISPQAINFILDHIRRDEFRIKESMFVNLWQNLIDDQRKQRATATEVEASRQEVMLMLGPLLENLDNDLLDPAISRVFAMLDRAGVLPPAPQELEGHEIQIKFISIMHQLQQATGLSAVRTFMQETANAASLLPEALDKIDVDVIVDEIASITGIRPDAVVAKKEVEALRQARAQQEQQAQQAEQAIQATEGLSNISGVDPQKLSELTKQFSPAAAAQAGSLGPVSGQ